MAIAKSNFITKLSHSINRGSEDSVVRAIESVEENKLQSAVPVLMKLLERDNRIGVKCAAAVALRDMKADEAVPLLIKLIRDRRYKDQNGTFVYALQTLNWPERHAVDVAALLGNRSFEVRLMALQAIEEAADNLSESEKKDLLVGVALPFVAGQKFTKEIRETLMAALELLAGHELGSASPAAK